MIKILVDSSSDYTSEEIMMKDLQAVPLIIYDEGISYKDGIDITKDEFYHQLVDEKKYFKTSQPSPNDYVAFFEKIKEANDELICILLSSELSGTYQSAILAKSIVNYDKIYIFDTLSATAGTRLLVEEAIKMSKEGKDARSIINSLEELKNKVKIIASVSTLEYLARGGRISKTSALIGEMASIKPIITVKDGKVDILGKRLGINKTIHFILDSLQDIEIDKHYPVYSLYSYGSENCEKLENRLKEKGYAIANRIQIGSTIGTHVGPEAFGIAYIAK